MNDTDHHNAAATGAVSEELFKYEMSTIGLDVLTNQFDTREYWMKGLGVDRMPKGEADNAKAFFVEWKFVGQPKQWKEDYGVVLKSQGGKESRFHCDGYIPTLDMRYELKYSSKNGTTEEKVFYDLVKIKSGAYDDKPLLYVFYGPMADKGIFHLFKAMVDELGKNVKVIIDDEELTQTKNYLKGETA